MALELRKQIEASEDWSSKGPVWKAMEVLEGALRLYKAEEIAMSFNGGKDATVLLHLLRAAAAGTDDANSAMEGGHGSVKSSLSRIKCVYFERDNVFGEVEQFITDTETQYGLEVVRFKGSFKEGCAEMVHRYQTKAFLLGTRKSDPHGKFVEFFSPSTPGWPPFMRIHPVLLWSFQDVWYFLRQYRLAYCSLYDEGYTSLGETHNSRPNPLLAQPDGTFRPAHTLYLAGSEQHLERQSRIEGAHKQVDGGPEKGPGGQCGPRSLGMALKWGEGGTDGEKSAAWGGCGVGSRGVASVGLITIGNEVLGAKVQDVNTGHACKHLQGLGIVVVEALILPDREERIAEAVSSLRKRCTAVITMGGIGPTHDDVTMQGIAAALQLPMIYSQEMATLLNGRAMKEDNSKPACSGEHIRWDVSRMCRMPEGTRLLFRAGEEEDSYPVLQVSNVYMLPGVPRFCRQQLSFVGEVLLKSSQSAPAPLHARQVRSSLLEPYLADAVAGAARRFEPSVDIGSYPYFATDGDASPHEIKTILTIQGHELAQVVPEL